MTILNGKKIAEKILDKLKEEVKELPPIKLVVILVGDDSASLSFVKQKQKAAEKIGVEFKLYKFKENVDEQTLIEKVEKIVQNRTNTGVVIQLPLPPRINTQKILSLIPLEKDVDALSVDNLLVEPPTASGIMKILEEYNIKPREKKVVIIGRGRLVGKPLAEMMEKVGADLTICDKQTKNLSRETLKADILVSATGQPNLIKENMVKNGVIVIDAGTDDVDFENVKKRVSYITPPIGGVGPVTVAVLMGNLVKLVQS